MESVLDRVAREVQRGGEGEKISHARKHQLSAFCIVLREMCCT